MPRKTSYLQRVKATAQKSPETSAQDIAEFIRGSVIDEVIYESESDTLTISFRNEKAGKIVRTTTERISDIIEGGGWVETEATAMRRLKRGGPRRG